jgi:predicted kinase/predicted phosphodiesterase
MRSIIILRGPRSSGRKTFIQKQNLSAWLVDQNSLETVFGEMVTDPGGNMKCDPYQRNRARGRVMSILAEKMARGNLIVFQPSDTGAPFSKNTASAADRMTASVIEQARKYHYKVHILDFTETLDATTLQVRRDQEGDPLSEGSASRILAHMRRKIGIPQGTDIRWHSVKTLTTPFLDLVEPDVLDFNRWNNVIVIGDIHGCINTLGKLTDNFEVRKEDAYLFLGDYINKGPDSGAVLRTLMERFMPHENCHFLTGNHETGLAEWARGDTVHKKVFQTSGLPSIQSAGLTQEDATTFLGQTMDAAKITWRGLDILATHGGLACPPEKLSCFSAEHFQHGTEGARFDVDAAWEENVLSGRIPGPARAIQVHGHRNPKGHSIRASRGSFNLENGVDCGREMRALILSPLNDGYDARTVYIDNMDIAPDGAIQNGTA